MADLVATVAVIRAIRRGPVTIAQIAASTKLSQQVVYRLVKQLEAAGAPLERGELAGDDGRPAATLRLTGAGVRRWLD